MLSFQVEKCYPRNPLIRLRYRHFPRKPRWSKKPPDHMFDHIWRKTQNLNPGLAQLVARLLWEQDVGSSSLPSRTTPSEIDNFRGVCSLSIAAQVVSLSFLIYLFYSSCAKRKIIIRIIRLSSILIHMRMPSNQLSNLTFCTESIEQICRQACSIAI